MKKHITLIICMLVANICFAQHSKTYDFIEKDGQVLKLDVYFPDDGMAQHPCIMFYFGGGFITGSRTDSTVVKFCETMAYKHGFVAIAADYRLGLKGAKNIGVFNTKPVKNAINMAAEDAISAIAFVLDHSKELKINTKKIILSGSSAGAITSLQTDYFICNGFGNAGILPEDFHIAGVIPFSGAIFSTKGAVKYKKHSPAPTMFFHGMKDNLVPYKQIRFFNIGFIGSDKIVRQFEKHDYPYFIRRYENYAHAVAGFFNENIDEILWFYDNYVEQQADLQIDEKVNYIKNAPKVGSDISKKTDLYD